VCRVKIRPLGGWYNELLNRGEGNTPGNPNADSFDGVGGMSIEGDLAMTIQVLLVNEQPVLCVGVRATLARVADVEVVAVSNGYAYVTDRYRRMVVVDVHEPSRPFEIGEMAIPQHLDDVVVTGTAIHGDYIYMAQPQRLSVIDVSEPTQPNEVGFLDLPGDRGEVNVIDGYVYIRGYSEDLKKWVTYVVDVSDPAQPREAGFFPPEGDLLKLVEKDQNIYALIGDCQESGECWRDLLVFNEPPTTGLEEAVGLLPLPEDSMNLTVVGDHAYIDRCARRFESSCTSLVWMIVDISNPQQPVQVGSVLMPANVGHYAIDGDLSYIYWGQRVIDVSDPTQPREVGASPHLRGIKVIADGYIYVAGGDAG
jgi:hypothetical protein